MAVRARTNPRKAPSQERSRATVEAILEATARILVREGYDRASTNKVAAAAGVSIGSLYQYFPSKEALVGALIDRHSRQMEAVLQAHAGQPGVPIPEAARSLVRAMLAAHAVDPALHKVLMEQVPRVGRLEKLATIDKRNAALIRSYLEAHQPELRRANLDLVVFVLFNAVEAITHAAILERPESLGDQRLEEELVDLILRYLLKDNGGVGG